MDLSIKREGNKFYIGESITKLIGEIDFFIDEKNRIVVTHTYVDREYRGQGLANKLLDEVIKLAEKGKQFIVPICGFAVKVLNSDPKYDHLLDPTERDPSGANCDWRA